MQEMEGVEGHGSLEDRGWRDIGDEEAEEVARQGV